MMTRCELDRRGSRDAPRSPSILIWPTKGFSTMPPNLSLNADVPHAGFAPAAGRRLACFVRRQPRPSAGIAKRSRSLAALNACCRSTMARRPLVDEMTQ
jgi:hypothetical protein